MNRDVEIGNKQLGAEGSLKVALGNRWYLDDEDSWRIGALALFPYDNSWHNRERVERDVADPLTLVENKLRTINQVSAIGIINLGFSYTDDHEIATSSFYLRSRHDGEVRR